MTIFEELQQVRKLLRLMIEATESPLPPPVEDWWQQEQQRIAREIAERDARKRERIAEIQQKIAELNMKLAELQ